MASNGSLTSRQEEIVALIRKGEDLKGIAGALGLKESGVRTHLTRLRTKGVIDARGNVTPPYAVAPSTAPEPATAVVALPTPVSAFDAATQAHMDTVQAMEGALNNLHTAADSHQKRMLAIKAELEQLQAEFTAHEQSFARVEDEARTVEDLLRAIQVEPSSASNS